MISIRSIFLKCVKNGKTSSGAKYRTLLILLSYLQRVQAKLAIGEIKQPLLCINRPLSAVKWLYIVMNMQ